MKHKHFFGTSVHDAMQRARYKMGEEIFLIESKPVTIAGNSSSGLIQITVGIPEMNRSKSRSNSLRTPTKKPPNPKAEFSEYLNQFSDELYTPAINRHKPKKQLPKKNTGNTNDEETPGIDDLMKLLLSCGISSDHIPLISDEIKHRAKDGITDLENLQNIICNMFDSGAPQKFLKTKSQRIIALLGPTGVGKTSVTMKMAGNKQFFNGKKTAIISTDTYRIAGSESLKLFSELVDIPFLEMKHSEDLSQKIDTLQDYDVILIDTPGRSPLFPNYYSELENYFANDTRIEKLVVLSAAADLEDIFLSSALYTLLKPSGLVITKLDETSRTGKLVSIQNGIGLPILFVSEGQSIPLDLAPISGSYIWKKIQNSL